MSEKRFNCSPECFIICYIGCSNIAKEYLLCFSRQINTIVTLLVLCFFPFHLSDKLFECVWRFCRVGAQRVNSLFPSRDSFIISLVIVLLMKGAYFALTKLFFKGVCLLRVTPTVFLIFSKEVFLTRPELKLFWKWLIKVSFDNFLQLWYWLICDFCLM